MLLCSSELSAVSFARPWYPSAQLLPRPLWPTMRFASRMRLVNLGSPSRMFLLITFASLSTQTQRSMPSRWPSGWRSDASSFFTNSCPIWFPHCPTRSRTDDIPIFLCLVALGCAYAQLRKLPNVILSQKLFQTAESHALWRKPHKKQTLSFASDRRHLFRARTMGTGTNTSPLFEVLAASPAASSSAVLAVSRGIPRHMNCFLRSQLRGTWNS